MEKRDKRESKTTIILSILPLLSLVVVIVFAKFLKNQDFLHIIKSAIVTLLLTSTIIYYIDMDGNGYILQKKYSKAILIFLYIFSICLVMQPFSPEKLFFWLLGPLLISMIVNSKLGLMAFLNMIVLLSINSSLLLEESVHLLVIGLVMVLISKYLKQKTNFIYGAIIILSVDITIAFVIYNFVHDSTYNYLNSVLILSIILVLSYLIYGIYTRFAKKYIPEEVKEEEVKVEKEELKLEPIDTSPSLREKEDRALYERLLDDNNILWEKVREHSKTLYEQSKLIGEISARAAASIDADTLLCKAGGRFHEIGKINNKEDHFEQSMLIAEEYKFPQKLKDILNEYDMKRNKPTSVEAAIVMLTKHLVTTLEYSEKSKNSKFPKEKLVNQLLEMSMNKGMFDQTGMTIKDYRLLKKFFIKEFQNK